MNYESTQSPSSHPDEVFAESGAEALSALGKLDPLEFSSVPFDPNLPSLGEPERTSRFATRIRYTPSKLDDEWDAYAEPGTLDTHGAQEAITYVFGKTNFLTQTLGTYGIDTPPREVLVRLVQMGRKNGVYKATTPDDLSFITIMSRGGAKSFDETIADFQNLLNLRGKLIGKGVKPFVPTVRALYAEGGISAFSVDFLSQHCEVNVENRTIGGETQPVLVMNTAQNGEKANEFNETFTQGIEDHRSAEEIRARDRELKIRMATQLYLVHKTTGGFVPQQLCIDAGDFMADPTQSDFDLRLITVRGGWIQIPENHFFQWLSSEEEIVDKKPTRLFQDQSLVDEAIAIGKITLADAA